MINPKEESYGRSNRNNIRKRWSRKNNNNSKFRASLAVEGKKKVALIDTDIGLRNLDVVMGLENRIVYDIVDVVEEKCKLRQALIKTRDSKNYTYYQLPKQETKVR